MVFFFERFVDILSTSTFHLTTPLNPPTKPVLNPLTHSPIPFLLHPSSLLSTRPIPPAQHGPQHPPQHLHVPTGCTSTPTLTATHKHPPCSAAGALARRVLRDRCGERNMQVCVCEGVCAVQDGARPRVWRCVCVAWEPVGLGWGIASRVGGVEARRRVSASVGWPVRR